MTSAMHIPLNMNVVVSGIITTWMLLDVGITTVFGIAVAANATCRNQQTFGEETNIQITKTEDKMRIAKQPNGKYMIMCGEKVYINQTEDDYYDFVLDEARQLFAKPGYIDGVSFIIKNINDDKLLKDMGFEKPHSELRKYIPKKVVHVTYNSRDCETVGRCPLCNEFVYSGYGSTDKVCEHCGQVLEW